MGCSDKATPVFFSPHGVKRVCVCVCEILFVFMLESSQIVHTQEADLDGKKDTAHGKQKVITHTDRRRSHTVPVTEAKMPNRTHSYIVTTAVSTKASVSSRNDVVLLISLERWRAGAVFYGIVLLCKWITFFHATG